CRTGIIAHRTINGPDQIVDHRGGVLVLAATRPAVRPCPLGRVANEIAHLKPPTRGTVTRRIIAPGPTECKPSGSTESMSERELKHPDYSAAIVLHNLRLRFQCPGSRFGAVYVVLSLAAASRTAT